MTTQVPSTNESTVHTIEEAVSNAESKGVVLPRKTVELIGAGVSRRARSRVAGWLP